MLGHEQPSFDYERLKDPNIGIRLLTLLPGHDDDVVRCALNAVNATTQRIFKYHTLSYEWGQPGDISSIVVNEQGFVVQRNLHRFLREIRSQFGRHLPMTLWVDAICINQNDISEKNLQVRRMHSIYDQASSCLIWLGESSEDSAEAFRTLIGWIETPRSDAWITANQGLSSGFNVDDSFISQLQASETPRMWYAIHRMYSLTYWNRSWIVQEVLLSRKTTLFHGSQHLSSFGLDMFQFFQKTFKAASVAINGYSDIDVRNRRKGFEERVRSRCDVDELGMWVARFSSTFKATTASQIVRSYGGMSRYGGEMEPVGQELVDAFSTYASTQCKDLHDKVYAFLGLAMKHEEKTIQTGSLTPYAQFNVDYEVPLLDLAMYTLLFCRSSNPILDANTLLHTLKLCDASNPSEAQGYKSRNEMDCAMCDAANRAGPDGVFDCSADFIGFVADEESDPSDMGPAALFAVGTTKFRRSAGHVIRAGDIVFALRYTDLRHTPVFIIYRIKGSVLQYVGVAVRPDVAGFQWPNGMTIQTPHRFCADHVDHGERETEDMAWTGLRGYISLTLAQIFLIAAQTPFPDSPRSDINDLLSLVNTVKDIPKFLHRFALSSTGRRAWLRRIYDLEGDRYVEVEHAGGL